MSEHLDTIVSLIRQAVNEDWIDEFEITAETSFNNDLELESIEFVAIAEKIQQHYGTDINFIEWLGTLSLDEMIELNVGQLAEFVEQHMAYV
ncbi:Acyl carrier protein [Thalassocella blandensis]|nr:Acyl carrier protein [Thalassocella blandensis]